MKLALEVSHLFKICEGPPGSLKAGKTLQALRDASFYVQPGEIFDLLGGMERAAALISIITGLLKPHGRTGDGPAN